MTKSHNFSVHARKWDFLLIFRADFSNFVAMKYALAIVLVCTATLLFAAEAVVESFSARSDGRNITVEWRTSRETDVVRFEIERATGTQGDFRKIGTVSATGANSVYRFVDENAYLRDGSGGGANIQNAGLYGYRLKIVGADDKFTYTNPINVSPTVSSVRRTWGMIKEMFR